MKNKADAQKLSDDVNRANTKLHHIGATMERKTRLEAV